MSSTNYTLPLCPPILRDLLLAGKTPLELPPQDRILDASVQEWWWPLFRALGFEYHHFWSSVLHFRRAQDAGAIPPGPLVSGTHSESILLLFCLIFKSETRGHVCLPAGVLPELWSSHLREACAEHLPRLAGLSLTLTVALDSQLFSHGAAAFALRTTTQGEHFYTRQSLALEDAVVSRLGRLMQDRLPMTSQTWAPFFYQGLDAGQQAALDNSRGRKFFILTGGPGTGKTTLAKRIVAGFAMDFSQQPGKQASQPSIRLCAPTGRAASRLGQAFQKDDFSCPPQSAAVLAKAGANPGTVHGLVRDLERLSDPENGGPDLILVDETSMLDLRLMARVLELLPQKTSLFLLGDHKQLPSVDAGAILADLLQTMADPAQSPGQDKSGSAWASCLSTNYRACKTIKAAADDVQSGKDILASLPGLERAEESAEGVFAGNWKHWQSLYLDELCRRAAQTGNKSPWSHQDLVRYFRNASDLERLQLMTSVVILSPVKAGNSGIQAINRSCRQALGLGPESSLPRGMPVMVRRNDPVTGVYNGDRGVICTNPHGIKVLRPDASTPLESCPGMAGLPEWEASFAMTYHKSQGSEFDTVLLLVPPGCGQLLSRELLYTGMTRAKTRLIIAAEEDAWAESLKRHTLRHSCIQEGLQALLAGSGIRS